MEKDCCKVRGSLCGMRGSHHQFDCTCTGCRPNHGPIFNLMDYRSFDNLMYWIETLDKKEAKEFKRLLSVS